MVDQQLVETFYGPDVIARRNAAIRREEWLTRITFVRKVVVEFAFVSAILMVLVGLACFLIALGGWL